MGEGCKTVLSGLNVQKAERQFVVDTAISAMRPWYAR